MNLDKTEKSYAYVAWTNTDICEGRGIPVPKAICELESTAIRLGEKGSVQGADCSVEKVEIFNYRCRWYGPIHLIKPKEQDKAEQKRIDAKAAAIEKARSLGMTIEEIKLLQRA